MKSALSDAQPLSDTDDGGFSDAVEPAESGDGSAIAAREYGKIVALLDSDIFSLLHLFELLLVIESAVFHNCIDGVLHREVVVINQQLSVYSIAEVAYLVMQV